MPRAQKSKASQTPTLEWIAAGIGLVLLVAVLGAIGHDAVTGTSDRPPAIVVKATATTRFAGGYVVSFSALNGGGGTAAALEVEGELVTQGGKIETSTATIDYVPGNGAAEGGLFFREDPRSGKLSLRALGYQRP